MTHAQIAANARRPYVDKIKRDQATIAELLYALRDCMDYVIDSAQFDTINAAEFIENARAAIAKATAAS